MTRMSFGQVFRWSMVCPCGPTDSRSSPVSSTTPASVRSRGLPFGVDDVLPQRFGDFADRGAAAFVEAEPDPVVHPPPGRGVQRRDVFQEVFGGPGAVAGD